jgi:excisionase family DNA binding protein
MGLQCRTVTVSEAATILGIGKNCAYDGVKSGDIPAIRVGGRWLVPIDALEELLESAKRGGGEPVGEVEELLVSTK